MAIATLNPATGVVERTYPPMSDAEVERALADARRAATALRRTTFAERAGWMRAAADLLEADAPALAATMTREMGKTLASAEAEVRKAAYGCRFYAAHAEAMLAPEPADAAAVGAATAYSVYQPLGVVLAVMPWNFPVWQVLRFAAPALMAGNAGLLKHASNVPQTALYLGELFTRAGFPRGAFATLLIGAAQVEGVLRDDRVAAATLTGSEAAGRSVARIAGDALKKTVLELGGSDPFLVLPSADVARAAATAVRARCQNNGQSCIAAKRFIVHTDVYDEFVAAFAAGMAALRVGDPAEPGTDVGPIATESGRAELEELVADAVARGATVLTGGARPDGPGWFYPPTVLADVDPSMRLHLEEAFGPVATVYRVPDLDAALDLANATAFGLGAVVWTTDEAERARCVAELESGAVTVNGMTTSYPELPFGGVKTSGYGRELAAAGIREFCNLKAVWIGR
ncbi:NADP-dependent succinic semialdehyde dehydrogenase [Micromonospora carbonacea]|uniref:Succinate-semialdehyde dehydrogenase / glutarate-semialdehyde dehydrogenase n=1 Tax=Micromonospora carbonacea TaxID=47853 RepID=A0A1C4VK34_9ACTN|nr:NADP-dependent succinic semialdehyde dehydrogenase [Micromonospora carbonacea]SCE84165.1 succinate-semialdehyde dehydrogenase / glutarate-semialdehyde dehydrogenase [Micromonospora carbonacea]